MQLDSDSTAAANLGPGDHRLGVLVGAKRREFRVRVPQVRAARLPVIAFDGVTLRNQEGSMGRINGLDDAAEKDGFTVIYPIPLTRYFGIVAGWNTPGGYLSHRKDYDDVEYVRAILNTLQVKRVYAVGFSAGAQFAHILAGRLEGMIAGVVSVSGTWLGTEPSPRPGTAALVVHGEDDPVVPYQGGIGGLKVRLLAWLGNRNVLTSRPDAQVIAYALANGYDKCPHVEKITVNDGDEQRWICDKRTFGSRDGVPVVEYIVKHPYGGHTYHGRKTGAGTESALSAKHGRPLPPEMFCVNDLLAELNARAS